MPKIKVTKPFAVTYERGTDPKFYGQGEHELTAKQMDHWFVKGCIAEGRATVLADASAVAATVAAAAADLSGLTRKQLLVKAQEAGLELPSNASKPTILAALLEKAGN